MAQLLVRRIDDETAARLKVRAKRHGRSVEEELREILRDAARHTPRGIRRLGSHVAARFSGVGLAADLPELRQTARAVAFDR